MLRFEQVTYKHFGSCYRLSNDQIELLITAEVGPRIIRFGFVGGDNEFAEVDFTLEIPDQGTWRLYGGHRLWHAPEDMVRTYLPDNKPVQITEHTSFIRVTQPIEPGSGIKKEFDVSLAPDKAMAKVVHRLHNQNVWSVELAPWALSAMNSGGVCIVPLGQRNEVTPGELPATPTITLWDYTDMSDSRFSWGRKYILVTQDPGNSVPQKLGAMVTDGWAAYARKGHLFIKTVDFVEDAVYPDRGCSVEIFLNNEMLELETLGPLKHLEPGVSLEHIETWYLYWDIPMPASEDDVETMIFPLVKNLTAPS